jgi:hypothetical protein
VFSSYKLFDRSNTSKLLEDTIAHLLAALQSVPPSEEYLFRLMTFFGSRSTEQDRQKTLRAVAGSPGEKLAGSSGNLSAAATAAAAVAANGNAVARSNSAALLIKEAALLGKEPASNTAWKQFQSLYRPSLEDMEPGPEGVPLMVVVLTEAILSCGGETSVGLFRLQPSTEALTQVEERLDAGAKGEAFRNVSDPNIPGIILKRMLTSLEPPLIDKYAAVVDAVRLNKFSLLVDILVCGWKVSNLGFLTNFRHRKRWIR